MDVVVCFWCGPLLLLGWLALIAAAGFFAWPTDRVGFELQSMQCMLWKCCQALQRAPPRTQMFLQASCVLCTSFLLTRVSWWPVVSCFGKLPAACAQVSFELCIWKARRQLHLGGQLIKNCRMPHTKLLK